MPLTPNPLVRASAQRYNESHGKAPIIEGNYVKVNEPRARQIADAYDALPARASDTGTMAAYGAMGREVQQQWDHAQQDLGIHFEPWNKPGQPYANSEEMMADVANNNHLHFFQGGEEHPYLGQRDASGLSLNDKFRAVHDLFGHAAEGYGFGPRGEENAWIKHSQMFSPLAQRAMSTETRGENSWTNFGRQNYDATGAPKNIHPSERPFAQQKLALLPPEHTDWQSALQKSAIRETRLGKALRRYNIRPRHRLSRHHKSSIYTRDRDKPYYHV